MVSNYYISSFFWGTLSKILTALVGFISVPLLLGYYGRAEYGILSIATACNGYMHLLDLGMNTGAVKFFSQWKSQGDLNKIHRVARTNITFYLIISFFNIVGLLVLAIGGEGLFSITHEQFLQLRLCLFIISLFSVASWGTTTFNQLLIADKQMAYTMKVQCVMTILKVIAIILVFTSNLKLTTYFFYITLFLSLAIFPYAYKCRKEHLIDSLRPVWYWKDFKIVLLFSLSIFFLSIFQVTATQSRPILLSMFANDGAMSVADFRIIEVVPQFIIMLCGTFSGIFLPKTSEMVAKKDVSSMRNFAYKWTVYTTALAATMCFPVILCSHEVLTAYVGSEYVYLSKWLALWCFTVLLQMHTTPGNALVLAHGKTKVLVRVTAVSCIASMLLNIVLCKTYDVGSAIIAYLIYVIVIIGSYYIFFYKNLLHLSRYQMFKSFILPTFVAIIITICVYYIPISVSMFENIGERYANILVCIVKSAIWLILYVVILQITRIVNLKQLKK